MIWWLQRESSYLPGNTEILLGRLIVYRVWKAIIIHSIVRKICLKKKKSFHHFSWPFILFSGTRIFNYDCHEKIFMIKKVTVEFQQWLCCCWVSKRSCPSKIYKRMKATRSTVVKITKLGTLIKWQKTNIFTKSTFILWIWTEKQGSRRFKTKNASMLCLFANEKHTIYIFFMYRNHESMIEFFFIKE